MPATIRAVDRIAARLGHLTEGLVFQPEDVGPEWSDVAQELRSAFELTKAAAVAGAPVVYVVSSDALLGRSGTGNAMIATGLLSAARTLAAETKRDGVPANVLGIARETPAEAVALWAARLLEREGPTGELIQLGGGQIGKALA